MSSSKAFPSIISILTGVCGVSSTEQYAHLNIDDQGVNSGHVALGVRVVSRFAKAAGLEDISTSIVHFEPGLIQLHGSVCVNVTAVESSWLDENEHVINKLYIVEIAMLCWANRCWSWLVLTLVKPGVEPFIIAGEPQNQFILC